MAPRLEVSGLRRSFGSRCAVESLDLVVEPGEFVALLGPNGAGKSTSFALLSGLLRWDAGTLRIDGLPRDPGDPELRRRLGLVFQAPSLDGLFSARENLVMSGRLYGLAESVIRSRVDAQLELWQLSDRADEPVSRWSGGMRRRLELARALLHEPEILLMDEPTAGLDAAVTRRLWAGLFELRERTGLTVILTTHRMEDAEQCDRVAVMDLGRVVASGSPAELKEGLGGDVVELRASRPEELVERVEQAFGLSPTLLEGGLILRAPRAHELVPRLVEAFDAGRLDSISVRSPGLADVFLQVTGRRLGGEEGS